MSRPPHPADTADAAALVDALERRARRAVAARHEAETLLEQKSRELIRSNHELRLRHDDLRTKLEVGNRLLLRAQRTAAIATIHRERSGGFLVSPEFATLLGREEDAKIGPPELLAAIHPLDRPKIMLFEAEFYGEGESGVDHRYEHRIVRHDGKIRWLRWILRRDVDADGRLASVSGTVQDVTEQRATERRARALELVSRRQVRQLMLTESRLAERVADLEALSAQLRRSQVEVEAAYRARAQFMTLMSHDIRTPMNGLLGMMTTLGDTQLNAGQRRQLELAQRAGNQLQLLLDGIIEIASGQSESVELRPTPLQIAQTVGAVADFWQVSQGGDSRIVSHRVDPDLPDYALLDQVRFRQLLDNLVSHAIRNGRAAPVRIEVSANDGHLRVAVRDDGPPLADDKRGLLTAMPETVEALVAGNGENGDVALAVCRRLVEVMAGRMGVDTHVNSGNSLWFELPLHPTPAPAQRSAAPVAHRRVILVADDVETNRIVLCGMLEAIGYDCDVAENGAEALAAVESGRFDAVLMDVQMPVMDGTEATRRIRALDAKFAAIPIIGVTAHAQPAERNQLLAAGMTDCLIKPIRRDMLASALTALLGPDPTSTIDADVLKAAFAPIPAAQHPQLFALMQADLDSFSRALAEAWGAGDAAGVARASHSLKGVAANFGARDMLAVLADIEAKASDALIERLHAANAATIAAARVALGLH